MKIKRALISVSDKNGIVDFARELNKLGVEIVSTGGTAHFLKENNIPVVAIEEFTGFPEIMEGRVKTLHPKVHGAILCSRQNKKHVEEAKNNNIQLIDLVVVNLYPFDKVIQNKDLKLEGAVENIDIGGPSMIRSAAKNFEDVAVVVDPDDYAPVIEEIKKTKGVGEETRKRLAVKAFAHTARYDTIINNYFNEKFSIDLFPPHLNLTYEKVQDLRYGENPHQKGAFYHELYFDKPCVSNAKQLHGKQLSYNNIIDANDALELVRDFKTPTAAVIKHTNPCGVASRERIEDAYMAAYRADPMSAFGSVIALNRACNLKTAKIIRPLFVEVVICPKFEKDTLDLLKEKKDIRLLETGLLEKTSSDMELRKVVGGLLVQTKEFPEINEKMLKVVTKRSPTKEEIKDLLFAWKVNKHVKSNSIVFAKDETAVGVGAGQMSRVDSSMIAARKAGEKAKGAVMSSDAFFPFRDGVDEAAKAGITAIIQPGGSIRDQEVIDAANEFGLAMVFTGIRLFKH